MNWQSTFFTDGLHFNADGQQAVLKLLVETIDQHLPHLRYEPSCSLVNDVGTSCGQLTCGLERFTVTCRHRVVRHWAQHAVS